MVTVSDAFYAILQRHGVGAVFGNPGSNELSFLTGLPPGIPYYLALQEGAAIGMADAYAQASGTIGFLNLHAASGTGNAMGGLTNTAACHTSVVIMAGQQARRYVPVDAMLTNNEAIKLCDPLVKWAGEPLRPEDVPVLLSRALMLADSAPRGPVYLSVPLDDWDKPVDEAAFSQLLNRSSSAAPVAHQAPLDELTDALRTAASPALVLGPGVDTEPGFTSAIALAERANLPVYIAPSPPRSPFPTRHPCYQRQLPSAVGALADALSGHDVIVTFGAPVFRYHAPSDADYLPPGVRLLGVTDDPDEAARAPIGRLIVGDPSDALARVAQAIDRTDRPKPPVRTVPEADTSGPKYTAEAILDAVDRGKSDDAMIALEWTSADLIRDRLTITRPHSLFYCASGGLGWGLPAAVGLGLGCPDRPVLALIGDGAMQYTPSALWSAVRYRVPATFVVCTNTKYRALQEFSELLHVPGGDYLDISGIDVVKVAEGYGVAAHRAESLDDVTEFVSPGEREQMPRLIEVLQR
ncbi:benzoylformate decarboxylase [Streptomyces gibsoniae]|uniref:Benzoylformate decarboxylase n=1 Tax=Streptomyces gibsoniae TaxID=3075529 RepID=A0ABU2U069_9ACTN|nr:benzoylformate decarboxylase [Streptomyces sp. DSM 41699]MDT0466616.1 benzoylformate decarboxylase [Streptomyces sp. DSM 41699]